MEPELLEIAGLTKNEAKIYLALIKIGSAPVSKIAAFAEVHRVNAYDSLETLQKKGFVGSIVKSNKKYFEAADPKILTKKIEEKEKEIHALKNSIAQLHELYIENKEQKGMYMYRGIKGVKSVFEDMLNQDPEEILDFGATQGAPVRVPIHTRIWHSKRIKKRIKMKILVSKSAKNLPEFKLLYYKYLQQEFINLSSTIIYNNRVAIIIWGEEPMAMLIISKELAESYREYFYSLWNSN